MQDDGGDSGSDDDRAEDWKAELARAKRERKEEKMALAGAAGSKDKDRGQKATDGMAGAMFDGLD